MMFFITPFFSVFPLQARWHLPYIIKNNSSEGLSSSTTNHSPCLNQCNGKIKLITHSCCPFRTNYRSNHQRYSMKKDVFRNFTKFIGKCLYQSHFLSKVAGLQTLVRVLSCEFREISKNTFFTEHLWATASVIIRIFTDFSIAILSSKFVAQRRI